MAALSSSLPSLVADAPPPPPPSDAAIASAPASAAAIAPAPVSSSSSSSSSPSSSPSSTIASAVPRRRRALPWPFPARLSRMMICCSSASSSSSTAPLSKDEEYNRNMQREMRNPYEYHHDLGIYYTRILDNVLVGSQPQTPADIDRLRNEEGVGAILNLQQDKDIEYWGVDINSITKRCEDLGIVYMRNPARDFDANSLREELPKAVCGLQMALSEGKTAYVHCSAGLGRAPAVVIAYLFWFHGMNLNDAYEFLTSKRPCGPKKEAIRGATYDLAKNDPGKEPFESLSDDAFTDVAAWERQLIQDKICGMRNSIEKA